MNNRFKFKRIQKNFSIKCFGMLSCLSQSESSNPVKTVCVSLIRKQDDKKALDDYLLGVSDWKWEEVKVVQG